MKRIVWTDPAKSDVRSLSKPVAMQILDVLPAMSSFVEQEKTYPRLMLSRAWIRFKLISGSAYLVVANATFPEFTEPQDVIGIMPCSLRSVGSSGVLRSSSSYSLAPDRAIASAGSIDSLLLSMTRMLIAPFIQTFFFRRATSEICSQGCLFSIG